MGIENIGRKDVIWNYVATFFQIGAGVILLPFILKMMSSETVGIWTIFSTITSLIALLDFGFNPSFTRNISYIFSGVKEFKKSGIAEISRGDTVDFGLLKGTISAMRWFYSRLSVFVLIILLLFGSFYIQHVLKAYTGNKFDAYGAWVLLCLINAYNLYTLYYDSLLQGKGLIKKSKQIMIIGQCVYLFVAIILVYMGEGLIAIVLAQTLSIVIKRILSYKVFFSEDLKLKLSTVNSVDKRQIINVIFPNAFKLGLTSIGGFLVNKSSIVIGSLFLTLDLIATYGITMQIISILMGLAGVYFLSYLPKIAQYRATNELIAIKQLYFKSVLVQLLIYVMGGTILVLAGNWALSFIGSQTKLLGTGMIVVALLISFLESNHSLAASFLLAKNEVPFFIASLWSGFTTLILLWLLLSYSGLGLWSLILAPGITQAVYQNWKWPLVLINELRTK